MYYTLGFPTVDLVKRPISAPLGTYFTIRMAYKMQQHPHVIRAHGALFKEQIENLSERDLIALNAAISAYMPAR
ncbi:hypothetical protein NONI108955_44465 [Nocardia ninae]|uniref:Uncharacterized protein n=1 Tax=Nocardia ninae NBRC 108245 TaxID=1210091 RepID=A0A511ML62_9NOCA|nr:hypothetical protein [Nocardia ninae]GEM40868.1 hypothetical protein NN4_53870 [Nocardia ninae NBRC 108245]